MPSWLEPAVELRLGKISRRLAQNFVRLPELSNFTLQRLDPLPLLARRTRTQPLIPLGLADPATQGLRRAADLRCNRSDRRPLRRMIGLVVQYHPHGSRTHFGRVSR